VVGYRNALCAGFALGSGNREGQDTQDLCSHGACIPRIDGDKETSRKIQGVTDNVCRAEADAVTVTACSCSAEEVTLYGRT
jgi:hypothetical protein